MFNTKIGCLYIRRAHRLKTNKWSYFTVLELPSRILSGFGSPFRLFSPLGWFLLFRRCLCRQERMGVLLLDSPSRNWCQSTKVKSIYSVFWTWKRIPRILASDWSDFKGGKALVGHSVKLMQKCASLKGSIRKFYTLKFLLKVGKDLKL